MAKSKWLPLTPAVTSDGLAVLTSLAKELAKLDTSSEEMGQQIHRLREDRLERALECAQDSQAVRVCASVLCDLRGQGWRLGVRKGQIRIALPDVHEDPEGEKGRVRAGLLMERDRQLRESPVRKFICELERRRLGPRGDWVSVFSLMRDGASLATDLLRVTDIKSPEKRITALAGLISPYLQLADDSKCRYTGIPLKEIWRYFRYTWSSPHKSLPGRTIWYLVRDAAAPHHPVIGIAALGSAVVQLGIRDEWIGWTPKAFIERLRSHPSDEWARWVDARLRDQLDGLFTGDLAGLIDPEGLIAPTREHVTRLREIAERYREEHRLYGSARDHKAAEGADVDWDSRARTPLFVSKRAATLADVLDDMRTLHEAGFTTVDADSLNAALTQRSGRRAIVRILRRVKAAHVGIDMLDITVCGAVAPYNHLLGGKLVSLLLASPEVWTSYQNRYSHRPSVIASSMSGRAVCRVPKLVLLGTTSLYGVGSSQYNRLTMGADHAGGQSSDVIRFKELGETVGYGSLHFSTPTLKEIRTLYAQNGNGRTVKHIFGEGANPRMREVREALDRVGFPSDRMLRHENRRVVYTVPLASNFRDVLIEKESEPTYMVPQDDPVSSTAGIATFWTSRWLNNRIENARVLKQVAQHSVAYPVDHGARVRLPDVYERLPLFVYSPEE